MSTPGTAPDQPGPPVRVADLATSVIRTWIPIIVGAFLAWAAATTHTIIPAHASAAVGATAAAMAAAWWYALARLLEHGKSKTARSVGRYMLGGVVPPIYLTAAEATKIFP